MNLEFTEDVEFLVSQASVVLQQVAPVDRFRTGAEVWDKVVDAGWGSLGDAFASGDIDRATVAAIGREAGRVLLTEQFVTSGFLVPALLYGADGPEVDELRHRLVSRPVVVLGDGRNQRLTHLVGEKTSGFCFGVGVSEPEVVRLGQDGSRVRLEYLEDPALDISRVAALSNSVAAIVAEAGRWVPVPTDISQDELDALRRTERLVHSAAMLGTADEIMRITRDYTLNRIQFNVPIASFQAIKHALADVLASTEVAWAALLCACADDVPGTGRDDVARMLSLEAADLAAQTGAQFHGGIGFTWECDLHFYLKAVLDGRMRYGSLDELAAAVARQFMEEVC